MRYHHRYREIASAVSRHGLWWLVQQFGLDKVPVLGRLGFRRGVSRGVTQAQHLRLALEELGPTFIKLGQILSTRDDLLPPDYIAELSRLREHAPPVPADEIIAVIEAELVAAVDERYATFAREPLATASIGQVHAATLRDGRAVVVKVQKPGVPERIEEDLQILHQLAQFAQRHSPLARDYDLVELAEEFSWTLRTELDYIHEARNAERFRSTFAENPDVVVPEVCWDLSTARVLTLERIDGLRIEDLPALDAAGIDRPALARRAARIILDEVFVHHFFHADPHPGNFAVRPDGTIVAYDFGMVGRLSNRQVRHLLTAMLATTRGDVDRIIDSAVALDIVRGRFDRAALRRDLERLLDRYASNAIKDLDFEHIIRDMMDVIREHRMRLPADLVLLLKTIGMHQTTARRLDPSFTPLEIITPYARRAVLERYRPSSWTPRMALSAEDAFDLLLDAPQRIDRLIGVIESGNFETSMRVVDWDRMLRELQVLVNRLVVAWLVGTSLISLSVLLAIYRPEWIDGWLGPLFWLGATVTVIAGGILALLVLRRRF